MKRKAKCPPGFRRKKVHKKKHSTKKKKSKKKSCKSCPMSISKKASSCGKITQCRDKSGVFIKKRRRKASVGKKRRKSCKKY